MMRYWTFYIAFYLFCFNAFSQNFNYDIHSEFNNAQANILLHNNNLYFASKRHHSGSSQILDIYSYTKAGTFRFKKSFALSEGHDVAKLIVANDGNIAFFGQHYVCDVATQYPFLMKLDTSGNVLLSKTYTTSPMVNNTIIDGCQLPNNNYYFISNNKIFNVDALGNYISVKNTFDTLVSITPYHSSNFIVNAKSTNFYGPNIRNFVLTPTLAIASNYTTTNYYTKIIQNKGSYFGLTKQGFIEKLDTTFHAIADTKTLQNYSLGNKIYDFTLTNDTVYSVGYKNTNISSMFIRTDTNLVMISNNQSNSPQHLPNSIVTSAGTTYILANNNISVIPHISLVAIPKNSMYSFNNDIKLSRVAIDSSFTIHTYTYSNSQAFVDIKFKATVKNVSNIPLNSFYLTANLGSFSGLCYKRLFHKNYNGLNVAPGDSITVSTDSIMGLLTAYFFPNYITLTNLCFIVTSPNGQDDNYSIDNINCPGISVGPTGILENKSNAIELVVYPNPANNKITILTTADIDVVKAQVINNIGQVVKEINLNFSNNRSELIISDLPNGIYSINLNGNIAKRFIVMH